MPKPVVTGALLSCTFGMAPGAFSVPEPPTRPVFEGKPVGVITDITPKNIAPFGMCQSISNPTVAQATAAALGVLTPMPCVPAPAGPWKPGSAMAVVSGQPAITESCQLMCMWGGVITVAQPGSMTTQVN
jgi:hypothetical protein